MSVIFADTSAVAKRYILEIGSAWVQTWIEPARANTIVISEVTVVELVSALARRRREGALSPTDFAQLRDDFLLHAAHEYVRVGLDEPVLLAAGQLVATHPLRALDAIQLACALEYTSALGSTPVFISADRNLLAAATASGLPTDDPNAPP